ncbi:transposase [Inhella sp.]|uniref:transposase n=1 Tax=Inhella sp. TaxID=1921806 RepID=UPI0035B47890
MARQARLIIPGALHHVLQRGNNRQVVFHDDEDRLQYLTALREATRLHGVRVHAYALMDNHVHLLVTPQSDYSLARAMQTLGRRYVAYFNRRHARSGTLWEGRFRTMLAEDGPYFENLLRYVELQPVRAGLCELAMNYPWSSAAHHLGLRRDALVSEHPCYWAMGNTPFERELRHRQGLAEGVPPALLERIRKHVHSGWPLLTPAGARALAAQTERSLVPRPVGRPRRQTTLSPIKNEA